MSGVFNFLGDMLEQNRQIEGVITLDNSVVHFLVQRRSSGKYSAYCFFGYFCCKSYPHKLQKLHIRVKRRRVNAPATVLFNFLRLYA